MSRKQGTRTLIMLLVISLLAMFIVRMSIPSLLNDIGDFFTIFSFIALVVLLAFGRRVSA